MTEITCDRCDGDGKAHGSDRPFEWHGPGTYPGPCPKCNGTCVIAAAEIREQLGHHEVSLSQWQNGFLSPTEPDVEERELTMERLKAAIYTLKWVLREA